MIWATAFRVLSLNSFIIEDMRTKKAYCMKMEETLRKWQWGHGAWEQLRTGVPHLLFLSHRQHSYLICVTESWLSLLCHWSLSASLSRPQAHCPATPVTVAYTPSVPTVAPSQNFSYHNTDSGEVKSASQHCPPNNLPAIAQGETLMLDSNHSLLCSGIYYGPRWVSVTFSFYCFYRGRSILWSRDGEKCILIFHWQLFALIYLSHKHNFKDYIQMYCAVHWLVLLIS